MKRTKYLTEFKPKAVKQILDKGHSSVEASSRLGLPATYFIPELDSSRGQIISRKNRLKLRK
jgi:transposase-like protein